MDKRAYELGVKLAMADVGLLSPETDATLAKLAAHPAESLATILQASPDAEGAAEAEPDEPIGAPKGDGRTFSGSRSGNITNDLMNSIGLDIRGPEITSI
jgi:hypothetical protein